VHKDFATWYRLSDIEPSGDTLRSRWAIVEAWHSALDIPDLLDLARLSSRSDVKRKSFVEKMEEAFRAEDPTFSGPGAAVEYATLAGATLVQVIDSSKREVADVAALALVCYDCQGRNKTEYPNVFVQLARSALRKSSLGLHEGAWPKPATALGKFDAATVAGNVPLYLEQLHTSLKQWHSANASWRGEAQSRLELQQRELDILWWVLGGYSRDLEEPLGEVHHAARGIVVGKELAELVGAAPGPLAAPALLNRMLRGASATSHLTSATESLRDAPVDWLKRWATEANLDLLSDVAPIRFGASRLLEFGGNVDAWKEWSKQGLPFDVDAQWPDVTLAHQVYCEMLLGFAVNSAVADQ
jgi:hypothetical protein